MRDLQQDMQKLRQQQELVTDPTAWMEYQRQIDEVNDRINILKGNLPKDKEAVFTFTAETSEVIDKLKEIQGVTVNKKTLTVTADTSEAMQEVQAAVADIEGTTIDLRIKVPDTELEKLLAPIEENLDDLRTPFQKLQDSIRIEIAEKNIAIDENALHSLMTVAIENGLENLNVDFTAVQEQIAEGMNIPDERWMELADNINEKLAELGIEPITLDVQTGNLKKDGKDAAMSWQEAAHSVQAVGSALQQLGDPGAKIIGTIAQAIANVALAFSEADVKEGSSGNIWSWIAATAAGLATMVSTIATIKSSTSGNFAEGGIVPGNSYSGDNIKAYGLNSGELILSASQQNNIAGLLQGNSLENLNLSATVSAEQIRFVLNNRGRRTGRGEYIQAKFR